MKLLPLLFALLMVGCGAIEPQVRTAGYPITFTWYRNEIRWIDKSCLVTALTDYAGGECDDAFTSDGKAYLLFGNKIYELIQEDGPISPLPLGKLLDLVISNEIVTVELQ